MRNELWCIILVLAGCGQAAKAKVNGNTNQAAGPTGPVIRVPQDALTPALGFQIAAARQIATVRLDGIVFAPSKGNVTYPVAVPRGFTLESLPGATLDGEAGAYSSTALVTLETDSTLRGITMIDTALRGIHVVESKGTERPTVEQCKIVASAGIRFEGVIDGVTRSNVIHLPATLFGSGGRGIEVLGCVDPILERNTIAYLTKAIVCTNTHGYRVEENIISHADVGFLASPGISGQIARNLNAATNKYIYTNGLTLNTSGFTGNPGFVNRDLQSSWFDLRLAPGSQCRNIGKTGGPIGALGTANYRTTFTATVNPQSPPTGTYRAARNMVIFIFDLSAGTGGPVILNVGDTMGFGGLRSGQPLGSSPTLYESGSIAATQLSGFPSVYLEVSRRIEIQAGTTRTFTLTGDTTQFTSGDTLFLQGVSVSWSDGVVPTISDGITPTNLIGSGLLTIN